MTTGTVSHAQTLKGWFVLMKDSKNSHPGNKLWGNGWGWSWFDAGNPSKTTSTDYKQDCLPCHEPARATDWGIDRFQLLQQERDLLRFAGEHGIPVPEVIAYFDPHDGPVVLVLEQINVDGTLSSDTEIGETPWRHAEFVLRVGQSGGVDRRRNHRGPLFLRRYLRVSERPASRDAAAARCNRTRK